MTIPDTETPMPTPPRRRVSRALMLSLCVNLFLVGLLAAPWLFHPPPPLPPGHFDRAAGERVLPPEWRAPVREVWARHDPSLRLRMREVHTALKQLRDTLLADHYSQASVDAAHRRLGERLAAARAAAEAVLANLAQTLPSEVRRRYFAETLGHPPVRPPRP